MISTFFAQVVLICCDDLSVAQAMMFILGTTFAGKSVIGFTYLIEFMTTKLISDVVFVQLIIEPVIIILITVWY
jgi:hypothetical protein